MVGYATPEELEMYAAARGVTLELAPEILLTRALDWIELQPFSGRKTDPSQLYEFPRNGHAVVPEKIKTAQMVAAMIIDAGGDLLAAVGPRVTQETVVGAVSISYSDKGPLVTMYPQLTALLRGFLTGYGSGGQFKVSRG